VTARFFSPLENCYSPVCVRLSKAFRAMYFRCPCMYARNGTAFELFARGLEEIYIYVTYRVGYVTLACLIDRAFFSEASFFLRLLSACCYRPRDSPKVKTILSILRSTEIRGVKSRAYDENRRNNALSLSCWQFNHKIYLS